MEKFEPLDHPSDVGITAYGDSMAEVFQNAAFGMFSLAADLEDVGVEQSFTIEVEAEDKESLLVNFLNELLYLYDTKHVLLKEFKIDLLSNKELKCTVLGENIDLSRHRLYKSIKAATYNQLLVKEDDGRWIAKVVFDV